MQKTLILIICIVFTILEARAERYEFNFNIEDFEVGNIDNMVSAYSRNSHNTHIPSSYDFDLPVIFTHILAPHQMDIQDFNISLEKELIMQNVNVATRCTISKSEQNTDSLEKNRHPVNKSLLNPVQIASGYLTHDGKTEKSLVLYPFLYDNDSKNLYFIKKLIIDVIWSKCNNEAHCLINKTDQAKNTSQENSLSLYPTNAQESDHNNPEYLIITSSKFVKEFRRLALWRNIFGVKTTVVALEDIPDYKTASETMKPYKLKSFLKEQYLHHGLKAVLLGGDTTIIPTKEYKIKQPSQQSSSIIPTDIYYTTFDYSGEWDFNKCADDKTMYDQLDLSSEIVISRLPAKTVNDVKLYIDKLIKYEQYSDFYEINSVQQRFLFQGMQTEKCLPYIEWTDGRIISDANYVFNTFIETYLKNKWSGSPIINCDTGDNWYKFKKNDIKGLLNSSPDFVFTSTHGDTRHWILYNDYFDTADAHSLTSPRPSIMLDAACHTGNYTLRESLGNAFIFNKQAGAVLYLGNSEKGWSTPFKDVLKDSLIITGTPQSIGMIIDGILNDQSSRNIGSIFFKVKNMESYYAKFSETDRWIYLTQNLIGDSYIRFFRNLPKPLSYINYQTTESKNKYTIKFVIPALKPSKIIYSYYKGDEIKTEIEELPIYNRNVIISKNIARKDNDIAVVVDIEDNWPLIYSPSIISNRVINNDSNFKGKDIVVGQNVEICNDCHVMCNATNSITIKPNVRICKGSTARLSVQP